MSVSYSAKRMIKSASWLLIIIGAIAAISYGLAYRNSKNPDYSQEYPIQGQDHIAIGGAHDPYNSNPPSSGSHYGNPAIEAFYSEELPDEQLIHNLEHGDIWITYHPRISDDVKDQLRKYGGSKFVTTPRSHNDTDIALVAWGRVDAFNLENGVLDEGRIKAFIKRYINKGPEKIPPTMSF